MVFMAFGICNQTKLVGSKFSFIKIGLKRGVFSRPGFTSYLKNGFRLDKPMRPPPPPASAASPAPAQLNGHMSTTSPDPFSNVVSPAEAQNLFNNDDAFAAFNKDVSSNGTTLRHNNYAWHISVLDS